MCYARYASPASRVLRKNFAQVRNQLWNDCRTVCYSTQASKSLCSTHSLGRLKVSTRFEDRFKIQCVERLFRALTIGGNGPPVTGGPSRQHREVGRDDQVQRAEDHGPRREDAAGAGQGARPAPGCDHEVEVRCRRLRGSCPFLFCMYTSAASILGVPFDFADWTSRSMYVYACSFSRV